MIFISVGEILEMAVRSGSIDSRFTGAKRALEGTHLHQRLQKRHEKNARKKGLTYESELTIKHCFSYLGNDFTLMGRIDGLIASDGYFTVEEIKSTTAPLDDINEPLSKKHLAQAKMYAYMYAEENHFEKADIYITYCSLRGEEKSLSYTADYEELRCFFYEIMDKYYMWVRLNEELILKRDKTLSELTFPFDAFRKGQRDLSVAVYKTLVSGKKLFASIPTGTGKTIGTLFPALKYMGLKGSKPKRIFYLTSKNTIKALAEKTLSIMESKGLYIVSVTLTAKEKACLNGEVSCNPVKCRYACGHFDRVNDCIIEILSNETIITGDMLKAYAEKHMVCPFELSLDIAVFSHIIICDYNYAFDPTARLSRFFDEDRNEEYIALIDEAHNLPDRSRDMYSAEFLKSDVLEVRKSLERGSSFKRSISKLNAYMLKEKYATENISISKNRDEGFIYALSEFMTGADRWLIKNEGNPAYEKVQDLYFKAMDYTKIDEYFDKHFVVITENQKSELRKTLFCRDSSEILRELEKSFRSIIFFSATLSPMEYFAEILGGDPVCDNQARLGSPFPKENLCVIKDNSISTLYNDREKSLAPIADRINTMYNSKKGNYICFFPSYEYMEKVYGIYVEKYSDENCIIQQKSFSEEERADFLSSFADDSAVLGFCVLGGVFSEGIDLKGSRLIGCCIIGVGLPKVSVRQNIIKDYFDSEHKDGFAYAYAYPGMIKVCQAGGRVIRSSDDKGVILLLDRRFSSGFYGDLLPRHWNGFHTAFGNNDIKTLLDAFWNK